MVKKTVTVCSSCLTASCWQGRFYCDQYKTAGTKEMEVSELVKLGLEHPDNWEEPSNEVRN